jgi:hypothetical protein
MAYYKVGLKSGVIGIRRTAPLEEIAENISVGEAICTRREVVKGGGHLLKSSTVC